MSGSRPRQLSELEGVCLGIVRKNDPCTAYRVRLELKEAPSSHWRASAGSVYPLLARIEEEGFIETTSDKQDGRGRKYMTVSKQGRAALKKWLLAGTDPELIASVTDPIRSRMFFLDLLGASQQVRYIDTLIEAVESYLVETSDHLENVSEADDQYAYLGALGAVKITAARLEWLRVVRERLTERQPD